MRKVMTGLSIALLTLAVAGCRKPAATENAAADNGMMGTGSSAGPENDDAMMADTNATDHGVGVTDHGIGVTDHSAGVTDHSPAGVSGH